MACVRQAAAAGLLLSASAGVGAVVVDLGPVMNGWLSINNHGDVAGFRPAAGGDLIFQYSDALGLQEREAPTTDQPASIRLNDSGAIVFEALRWTAAPFGMVCYRESGGAFVEIAPEARWKRAVGLNTAGAIVGSFVDENSRNHAYVLSPGGELTEIGPPGAEDSLALGINDTGQIVGQTIEHNPLGGEAWVYTPGAGYTILDRLGGTEAAASAINNRGEITGVSTFADGSTHAIFWSAAGAAIDLGVLPGATYSGALDINDAGVVLGYAPNAPGLSQEFLWSREAGLIPLGALLPGTLPFDHVFATAINDQNQIVAFGEFEGEFGPEARALRIDLGTIPAPGAWMLGAAAMACVPRRRR